MGRRKIRVAFVKFGGLSSGGTEKFLQIMAAHLPKDKFEVDYFYCDSAPYIGSDFRHLDTDPVRMDYLKKHGVNLVKFRVGAKDLTTPTHEWVDTDFWEVFNEEDYDIIQTGRAGHPEYPFTRIRRTPIVDSLHLSVSPDNQFNIARVMHICKWNADKWVGKGGDGSRIVLVSSFLDIKPKTKGNMREELGLGGKFVYGFHQRSDDNIFSDIPLRAYKEIESGNTAFLLLNGSKKYLGQAKALGLKNFRHVPFAKTPDEVYSFLRTLDVYAHGRKDGEVNSTAMAEAMYFGLPIVSHTSSVNNGHVECIGDAGRVVDTVREYAAEMRRLREEGKYYESRKKASLARFAERYELGGQMKIVEDTYRDVLRNPFPHPLRRRVYALYNPLYILVRTLKLLPARLSRAPAGKE